MFKSILVIAVLLGVTLALPPGHLLGQQHGHVIEHGHGIEHGHVIEHDEPHLTHSSSQVNSDGSYGYEYELSNGVAVQESGIGGHYATGGFRHITPEGEHIELAYTADENGFHPQGAHLPTPPPIPEEIAKALEYIQAHPTHEEQIDRQHRLEYNQ